MKTQREIAAYPEREKRAMKLILIGYLIFSLLIPMNTEADDEQVEATNILAGFSVRPLTSPNPPYHPFHPRMSTCTCFARHPKVRGDIGGVGVSRTAAHQISLANCFRKARANKVNAAGCQVVACTRC